MRSPATRDGCDLTHAFANIFLAQHLRQTKFSPRHSISPSTPPPPPTHPAPQKHTHLRYSLCFSSSSLWSSTKEPLSLGYLLPQQHFTVTPPTPVHSQVLVQVGQACLDRLHPSLFPFSSRAQFSYDSVGAPRSERSTFYLRIRVDHSRIITSAEWVTRTVA